MTDYASVEEIDRAFRKRLAEATDEELPTVKLELSDAKVSFYAAQGREAVLRAARLEALTEFPKAKEFEDLIKGNSAEEIKAAAKTIHDRLEALTPTPPPEPTPEEKQAAARAAYGSPTAGGGAPVRHESEAEQNEKQVREILARGDAVPAHIQRRFQSNRIKEAVRYAKDTPTYKS